MGLLPLGAFNGNLETAVKRVELGGRLAGA